MRRAPLLLALFLPLVALAAGPAGAHSALFEVAGKKVQIKTSGKTQKFSFQTEKKQTDLSLRHDPAADGFHLLVIGSSGRTERITLDPALWTKQGKSDPPKAWRYKDKAGSRGGITKVQLKAGQLKVKGKGPNWSWAPGDAESSVWVWFQFEDEWFCTEFGGDAVRKSTAGYFKGAKAPAPGACPDPLCGNGDAELGEQCDDGNAIDDDGCHLDCTVEPLCGDAILSEGEECEDGNVVSGDGCDEECRIERCGDGVLDPLEGCDDGNTAPGDGCSETCAIEASCGDGMLDLGEQCDDGNTVDDDDCSNTCTLPGCDDAFETTFDAIQSVILEGYGCSNGICHGQENHQSNLSLYADDPDGNWAALVGAQSTAKPEWNRVEIGDIETSFFYEKLAAATFPDEYDTTGTPMPPGGMLTPEHLEALELWIRGGAPREGVVADTADLLGGCLPPPTPLKVEPPAEPGPGVGVQLRSTAWSLPAESENEVCLATWYDFTATNLIPEAQQFDCPSWAQAGTTNPSGKCFRWHQQFLLQDPQSHHSIIHLYTGDEDTNDPGWGPWTFKMNDPDDPQNGMSCDPLLVDPATGRNEGCSGAAVRNAACVFGYGPGDWSTGFLGGAGTAPQFSGSQESHYLQELADGVYSVLPMSGIVVYNSHAFNLTSLDTTMAQYLNLELAAPADQLYPTEQIFDADYIFEPVVPPFETREYCDTYTIPRYGNLFWLSSHTHIRGVRWRTWLPPNSPCTPSTCTPGDPAEVDYLSTVYNDPLQLAIDPPIAYDSASAADRTILYCSLFDNGSTPDSPPVKRYSTSPAPPIPPGGPCPITEVACLNEGPNKGNLCGLGGSLNHASCDSSPGAGDGICDACTLRGGFTTEDEMFILLGNYFVD